ncbi:MAG: ribosomal RNA small subunit methyltransferase A [Nitrospinae bacterium]|nr:ribosomal RNA small subunit methyltransferase A [Nitrospinota bacterium]
MRPPSARPKKRFGQHFLVSPTVLSGILRLAELGPADTVLEIGAGTGVLTEALAARARRVLALELDRDLISPLRQRFADRPHVEIIHADALDFDLNSLDEAVKIVANLPYGTAVPILMRLLGAGSRWRVAVVMLQREVADRLRASPGTKAYGALTLTAQWQAVIAKGFNVPPSAFSPRPTVMSTLVKVTPRATPPVSVHNEALLWKVVRAAFAQRRKMLVNALAAGFQPWLTAGTLRDTLTQVGIEASRRGETLGLAEFARLADAILPLSLQKRTGCESGRGSPH